MPLITHSTLAGSTVTEADRWQLKQYSVAIVATTWTLGLRSCASSLLIVAMAMSVPIALRVTVSLT